MNDVISLEDVIKRGINFASYLSLYKIRKEEITDPIEKSNIYLNNTSKIKDLMVENGIDGEEINKHVSLSAMWELDISKIIVDNSKRIKLNTVQKYKKQSKLRVNNVQKHKTQNKGNKRSCR